MGIETIALLTAGAAVVGTGASIAGAAVGAAGAKQKAAAESQAYQYQAAVARNNAQIALVNASRSRDVGDLGMMREGIKTGALIGGQKAAQAANGLDVNVGTPVDVRASTAELGRLDALTIGYNASKEAFGSEFQSKNYLDESYLKGQSSKYATEAGQIGVATSILGGVSSVSDKWLSFKSKGIV
jgi:hypothetical protein